MEGTIKIDRREIILDRREIILRYGNSETGSGSCPGTDFGVIGA